MYQSAFFPLEKMSCLFYPDLTMQRTIMRGLIRWKTSPRRQPLILQGARQVGKTWLLKEFARTQYEKAVYVNFDENEKAKAIFQNRLDPGHVIPELEILSGSRIESEKTLIIFDEIQECGRALSSLKYFCEEGPEYHVAAAGSLLGVALHRDSSFPVGKVNIINMYPLSFAEFLDALGETRYQLALERGDYGAFRVLEDDLIRRLKEYYYVGGMPLAVSAFAERRDADEIRSMQRDILVSFERDFSKHINAPSIPKVGLVWDSIPRQLARVKKQFIYRDMKAGARASQFEDALYWLERAGLAYRVNRATVPSLPLAGFEGSAFKLYMVDVGLLGAKTGLSLQNFAERDPEIFDRYYGALTEQFVLQELKTIDPPPQLYYWENDRKKGLAELDFLAQHRGEIFPIEVKASLNLKAKSLKVYMDYYKPKTAVRFSLSPFRRGEKLLDIPLYLAGQFCGILDTPS
jgi:predicted AAA+ superfamily ATPase